MPIQEGGERVVEMDGFVNCSAILRCAVYGLVSKGEVVYVGKSKTAHARISTHWRTRFRPEVKMTGLYSRRMMTGIKFDEVWVRACMLGELDQLEMEMIQKYQPRYNIRGVSRPPPDVSMDELLASVGPMLPAAPEPRQRGWRGF